MSIPEPKFTLALKDGAFELRDYVATLVADVPLNTAPGGRQGIGLGAMFVFGTPRAPAKSAVIAPTPAVAADGDWLARFSLPDQQALTDPRRLPDPAVTLRALPPVRLAILRFSGFTGQAKVVAMTLRLRAMVKQRGLVPVGPSSIACYNAPWTPWFLHHNEVMVPVTRPFI